jgi:hypothetical protein
MHGGTSYAEPVKSRAENAKSLPMNRDAERIIDVAIPAASSRPHRR